MRHSLAISASILTACLMIGSMIGNTVAADDAKAVEGTWTPIKAELAGEPMPDAVLKTIILKLVRGKYEVSVAGKFDRGTYTQDMNAKPKGLVIQGTEGPNAGKTIPCIYELDGDTLRVCYDLSGKNAPADFKTASGTQLYLAVYTRKKE